MNSEDRALIVTKMVWEGKSKKEIAKTLIIPESRVDEYLEQMRRKIALQYRPSNNKLLKRSNEMKMKIIELATKGASIDEISLEVGVVPDDVAKVINFAIREANKVFDEKAKVMLADTVNQVSSIMAVVYEDCMKSNYTAIDAYVKLARLKTDIIIKAMPKVEEKNHNHTFHLFTKNSDNYDLAARLVENQPDLLERSAIEVD